MQILEEIIPSLAMSHELMERYTNEVVDKTMAYARTLVDSTPACMSYPDFHSRTALDLTLIIDGSRSAYENLQLINVVAEMIDVSIIHGSYISIIHGSTGRYLANRTNSLPNLFEQLRTSSDVGSKPKLD